MTRKPTADTAPKNAHHCAHPSVSTNTLHPVWETTIRTWQDILERDQAKTLKPINRLVMQYAPTANTSEQGKLRRALRTLRLILSSPTTREYRKLPEHTSSDSQTDHLPLRVHPSWRDHIPHQDLQHTQSWLQTLFRSPAPRSTKTTHTHSYELHRTATELPEFDVVRVTGHRHKGKQLHYRVEWTLEHLTDQQIADQEALGFEIQHRTPTIVPIALQKTLRGRPKCPVCNLQVAPTADYRFCRSRNCHAATHVGCTADPGWQCAWCTKHHIPLHWLLQEVQWKPSWQLAADVLTADSGESAILAYKQTRLLPPKHTTPRCWRLGFSGPRVTELLDLIACFVSVVTLYKQKQYGTWGYRTGHNQLPPASVCM